MKSIDEASFRIASKSSGRNESECIGDLENPTCYLKLGVEKKVRRHLMRARGRKGFGWKRWSTRWLYDILGGYSVSTEWTAIGCKPPNTHPPHNP